MIGWSRRQRTTLSAPSEVIHDIRDSRVRGAVLTLNPAKTPVEVSNAHPLSSRAIRSTLSQSSIRRTSQGVRNGALAGGSRPASAYYGASAPFSRVSESASM